MYRKLCYDICIETNGGKMKKALVIWMENGQGKMFLNSIKNNGERILVSDIKEAKKFTINGAKKIMSRNKSFGNDELIIFYDETKGE